jgi:hypothetical protein
MVDIELWFVCFARLPFRKFLPPTVLRTLPRVFPIPRVSHLLLFTLLSMNYVFGIDKNFN